MKVAPMTVSETIQLYRGTVRSLILVRCQQLPLRAIAEQGEEGGCVDLQLCGRHETKILKRGTSCRGVFHVSRALFAV